MRAKISVLLLLLLPPLELLQKNAGTDEVRVSRWFNILGTKCLGLGDNIDLHDDCFGVVRGHVPRLGFTLSSLD